MNSLPLPPGGCFAGPLHRYAVRAFFEDTDLSGVVYHANYLRWFERARSDLMRLLGLDQRAAYEAGCRRFDSAIGGLGGCPFAQDVLVGNIPTETLIAVLAECGAAVPAIAPLDELIRASAEIARLFAPVVH